MNERLRTELLIQLSIARSWEPRRRLQLRRTEEMPAYWAYNVNKILSRIPSDMYGPLANEWDIVLPNMHELNEGG